MGMTKTIAKNTLSLAVVQLVSQVSTLLLSIVLARYLGENDYGIYVYSFALASLAFIIADFSLGFLLVVEVSRNRGSAPQYIVNTMFLRMVLGGASMLIVACVVLLRGLSPLAGFSIMIVAASTFFNFLVAVFVSTYNAFERMHYVLLTSLVERAFTVSASIALVLSGFGLEYVVIVVLLGSILNFVMAYEVCTRLISRIAERVSIKAALSQLRRAIPFAVTGMLLTTLYTLNTVLVGTWRGNEAAAFYGVGYGLAIAVIALPAFFVGAMLPAASQLYKSSMQLLNLLQQKTMKYLFSLGLPMAIGGLLVGPDIILLLYGADYAPATGVFQILSITIAIVYFNSGTGNILASADLMRLNTLSSALGAVVNLVLCAVLIPFYGQYGAAYAFTFAFIAMTISGQYFLGTRVFKVDYRDIAVKPLIAGAGMAIVMLLAMQTNVFAAAGMGVVTYFAIFFALRTLNHEDWEIIRNVFRK